MGDPSRLSSIPTSEELLTSACDSIPGMDASTEVSIPLKIGTGGVGGGVGRTSRDGGELGGARGECPLGAGGAVVNGGGGERDNDGSDP